MDHATGQAVVWAGLQRPEVVHGGVICAVDTLVVMLVVMLVAILVVVVGVVVSFVAIIITRLIAASTRI